MFAIKAQITKCIDDTGYPTFVECRFLDAYGVSQIFHDKDVIFMSESLDRDSQYPVDGTIPCEIIERKSVDGREIVKISTEFPNYVESTNEEFIFEVLAEQITEFPWEYKLIRVHDFATDVEFHMRKLYEAFNKRAIETALARTAKDVQWANGWEGGFVHGRDAVREYWRRQFAEINPQLEIIRSEAVGDNRAVVTVRQIVKDLNGNLLADKTVEHNFTFENGLIKIFEIGDAE